MEFAFVFGLRLGCVAFDGIEMCCDGNCCVKSPRTRVAGLSALIQVLHDVPTLGFDSIDSLVLFVRSIDRSCGAWWLSNICLLACLYVCAGVFGSVTRLFNVNCCYLMLQTHVETPSSLWLSLSWRRAFFSLGSAWYRTVPSCSVPPTCNTRKSLSSNQDDGGCSKSHTLLLGKFLWIINWASFTYNKSDMNGD